MVVKAVAVLNQIPLLQNQPLAETPASKAAVFVQAMAASQQDRNDVKVSMTCWLCKLDLRRLPHAATLWQKLAMMIFLGA